MLRMRWTVLSLVPVFLFATGCAVNEVIEAEETELIVAETPPDESLLLDIGVVEFADGIPEGNDPEDTQIYEEIRSAEARYLPYHLKTTLQGTGHWGAVRVIPSRNAFTDIVISGAIEESDGEFIELAITVEDAPFVAIDLDVRGSGQEAELLFTTNVGEYVIADAEHPLSMREERPYLLVRDGLEALLARPVYYRLVEHALEEQGRLVVYSAGARFDLGASA